MIKLDHPRYTFLQPISEEVISDVVFSRTSYPPRDFAPSGGKTTPEYGLELDSDGYEHLSIIGERPIYDIIQASAEGASIAHIITRWRSGDESVLNQAAGIYGDFSNLPDNLAESHQAIINAQNLFNSLPLSEREKFGMNLTTFLHSFASMGAVPPAAQPVVEPAAQPSAQASATKPETITVDGVQYSIKQEAINI